MPVLNRPLIHYHLDLCRLLQIDDVLIVIGQNPESVRKAVADYDTCARDPSTRRRYVIQSEQRGIAHAIMQTRELVRDFIVVILADTYFMMGDRNAWRVPLVSGRADAVLSVRHEPNSEVIKGECAVTLAPDGSVSSIIEKPVILPSNLKPCGLYFFSRSIFDAIDETPPSSLRGEVEITDAIQTLISVHRRRVETAATVRWDVNINYPRDLLVANIAALKSIGRKNYIHEAAAVDRRAFLQHAVIGEGAVIQGNVTLKRVVALPKARISSSIRDSIVTKCVHLAIGCPGGSPAEQPRNCKTVQDSTGSRG
jgi:glucose-1-phosphate thymidylyltransferase